MATINWTQLAEEHELAHFRADLCLGSPQSYSLEEKRQICEGVAASANDVDSAMRDDFQSWPPEAQAGMLDLLEQVDPDNFGWWLETLVGEMPNTAPELA